MSACKSQRQANAASLWPAGAGAGAGLSRRSNLGVERYVASGDDPQFDVFDENGQKQGELKLPAGRQLVGFGDGTVYLARIDEDDLQWLERYRMR